MYKGLKKMKTWNSGDITYVCKYFQSVLISLSANCQRILVKTVKDFGIIKTIQEYFGLWFCTKKKNRTKMIFQQSLSLLKIIMVWDNCRLQNM